MREILHRIGRFFVRISTFISKEYFSAVSQPRLLGVLILGPFLILLIFGISYQNVFRTLRTIVVVPQDSRIESMVRSFADLPLSGFEVVNITPHSTGAFSALEAQLVDLVLVIPPDPIEKIEMNQHAEFSFYHQEIDPFEVAYVEIVADRITRETNRQLMLSAVEQSKDRARKYRSDIHTLEEIQDQAVDADQQDTTGTQAASTPTGIPGILWLLLQTAGGSAEVPQTENRSGLQAGTPAQNSSSGQAEDELQTIDAQLSRFIEMDSQVIVEPFRYETRSLSEINVQPVHFYVPAVLALLLQHIAVSLACLSIVSERFAGTMELMRAAPVNAFEVLLGKYLSFFVFLGILAAILTALVHWVLGVPIIGNWLLYGLAASLVLLVSLGFGFLISNFARSDGQAIQLSMVLLLASIFFSGFFLQLYRLRWPAQTVSWLIPSTYGLSMLQDIMLRGIQPETWMFLLLGGFAVALFIINWLRLRRLMVQG